MESNDELREAMERVTAPVFSFHDIVEVLNDSSLHLQQAKRTAILSRFQERMPNAEKRRLRQDREAIEEIKQDEGPKALGYLDNEAGREAFRKRP
jgi:hypothetical protein